jgi:bifunctional non-homologous end joining protein LigD
VPLLRRLARVGRAVAVGAMASSSRPPVALMHPTLVARPFHRAGWIYEEKVDGWRMVAIKGERGVRLVSRKGHDLTPRFPELVKALSGLKPRAFILDGEVAVYDHALISRVEWVRGRPTDELATLPVYMVFDLLELDGHDLRREPLRARRQRLERIIEGHGMIFPARRLSRNGLKAWEVVVAHGFEGLVAKNPESRYVPGRTLAWLKVKQPYYREGERGWAPKG